LLDFIFTLSATAAAQQLPDWPGKPVAAHWRYPDPTKSDWQRRRTYATILSALERQMRILIALPAASRDQIALRKRLREVAQLSSPQIAEDCRLCEPC
jgi:hypothetical protein